MHIIRYQGGLILKALLYEEPSPYIYINTCVYIYVCIYIYINKYIPLFIHRFQGGLILKALLYEESSLCIPYMEGRHMYI
jgi:hypothetical protein